MVERRKSKPGEVVPCVRGSSAGASPLRSAHPPHPRHELPRLPQRCEGCQPTHIPGLGRRMSSLRPVPRYPKREHYPTLLEARRTGGGAAHGQGGRVAGSGDCHERMPSTLPDLAKGQYELSHFHTFAAEAGRPAPRQMRNSLPRRLTNCRPCCRCRVVRRRPAALMKVGSRLFA